MTALSLTSVLNFPCPVIKVTLFKTAMGSLQSHQSLVQDINNLLYAVSTDNWKTVEVMNNQLRPLTRFTLLCVQYTFTQLLSVALVIPSTLTQLPAFRLLLCVVQLEFSLYKEIYEHAHGQRRGKVTQTRILSFGATVLACSKHES